MDTDFEGDLLIDQTSTAGQSEQYLARLRNEKIGFVFQFHYLLNEFTVLQNVMLPALKLNRYSEEEVEYRAMRRLKTLEIQKLALKKANQLSGGEKQRVAIARALINDPLIVMGDEPTGNLDTKNSENVFAIFKAMSEESNQTFLIVTHDITFAKNSHRIIEMEDGRIKTWAVAPIPDNPARALREWINWSHRTSRNYTKPNSAYRQRLFYPKVYFDQYQDLIKSPIACEKIILETFDMANSTLFRQRASLEMDRVNYCRRF